MVSHPDSLPTRIANLPRIHQQIHPASALRMPPRSSSGSQTMISPSMAALVYHLFTMKQLRSKEDYSLEQNFQKPEITVTTRVRKRIVNDTQYHVRDCHPLRCAVPSNLSTVHSPGKRFSRLQFAVASNGDFKFELIPLHSPLLGESLLVSFPPLINMLKFSGFNLLESE